MAGVFTGNQIVREDLSDAYLQSDVRKTPVTSRIRKGEKLKNILLYSWAIEVMDGRSTVGIPEGIDATTFKSSGAHRTSPGKRTKLTSRPRILANTSNK